MITSNFRIPYFNYPNNKDLLYTYLSTLFYRWGGSFLIKTAIIDLPGWNMDANQTITITLPSKLSYNRVIDIAYSIVNDNKTERYFVGGIDVVKTDDTQVTVTRTTSGIFDNVNFNDDTFSRGEITLSYTT
jgi:hypothetical protein